MLLQIDSAPEGSVVRCSGRIVQGDGAQDLLRAVMSQESHFIDIDLRGVSAIDAGGLGALVALECWARGAGRSVQLVNPSQCVRNALARTGLNSVLQVRPADQRRGRAA